MTWLLWLVPVAAFSALAAATSPGDAAAERPTGESHPRRRSRSRRFEIAAMVAAVSAGVTAADAPTPLWAAAVMLLAAVVVPAVLGTVVRRRSHPFGVLPRRW